MADGLTSRFQLPDGRDGWQAAAETLVRENRFTIAVVFPAIGALTLVASARALVDPPLQFNPYLLFFGTFVMRLPLLVGVAPYVDRRAGLKLLALTGFVYAIEFVGVTTGFPYGGFHYGIELGPMLLGTVPLALPLFFVPLVFNAYLLAILSGYAEKRLPRVLGALLTLLLVDLVLDPGAVALGFWTYDAGTYYGVPASNYLGWTLSGFLAVLAVEFSFDHRDLRARLDSCEFVLDDLVSFIILWGAINALYAQWIPATLSAVLGLALVAFRKKKGALYRSP